MRGVAFLVLLLFALAASLCVGVADARADQRSRYVDEGALFLVTSFGFKDGGTAQMNITVDHGGHAFLLACTSDGWREFSQSSIDGVNCNAGAVFPDCFYEEMNGSSASLAFEVETDKSHVYYYLGFLSCQASGDGEVLACAVHVKGCSISDLGSHCVIVHILAIVALCCSAVALTFSSHLSFLLENPNGQQLSWGYIPLPGAYFIMMLVWVPVTCCWIYNWAKHPHFKNKLHRLITVIALSKMLWCACSFAFWVYAAREPYLSWWFVFAYFSLWMLTASLILVTLMLIGRGWQIFDDAVGGFKYTMIALIAMLIGCEGMSLVLGGFVKFLLLVCYGFIVIVIVSSVQDSIKKLQRRGGEGATLLGENLYGANVTEQRITMFKRFNVVIVCFCVGQIAIAAAKALRLHSELWLSRTMLEILDLAVFLFIAYLFRIRSENVFYRLQGVGGAGKPQQHPTTNRAVTWAEVESDDEESAAAFEMQNVGETGQLLPGTAA